MVVQALVPSLCECESHWMHSTVGEIHFRKEGTVEACQRTNPTFVIKRPIISPPLGYHGGGGDLYLCKTCAAFYHDCGYRVGAVDDEN